MTVVEKREWFVESNAIYYDIKARKIFILEMRESELVKNPVGQFRLRRGAGSGVAKGGGGGKGGHPPRGAGLGGALTHSLQSFKYAL